MAVVDANYKFIWLNIGTNGAAGDAQIWNNNELQLGISTDRLHLPQPEPFNGDTADIPFFLIGDDVFAHEVLWSSESDARGENFQLQTLEGKTRT